MNALTSVPRARNTDPITSHAAAAGVPAFAGNHKERILAALKVVADRGNLGATAAEIAAESGLTVVQVDRRLVELQRDHRAYVLVYMGGQLVRGGYRVWAAA